MSHGRRTGSLDHAGIAKSGFLASISLFAGGVGELAGRALGSMPPTADQRLLGLEVVGVLVGFLVPIVFGAVLPLLHPAYRDVWIPRLGYDDACYERAIGAALASVGADPG